MASRVGGKPAFPDTLLLLEDFEYRPEARKGYHSQYSRKEDTGYHDGKDYKYDARKQENPPAAGSEIVFGLDYERMKKTYYKECGNPYRKTGKIVVGNKFKHKNLFI
jgi:hypothetical protein